MTRLADALLTGEAFSYGRNARVLDPRFGGQNGVAPNLAEWVSTTNYTRRNINVMLMEAPRGFLMMPDAAFYVNALKALIELHMRTWDGFNSTITVATAETQIGGAGEMLETPTNVTRERSQITSQVTDLYGRPFQNLLQDWIYYLIGDPDTKTPMISAIAGVRPEDMLADMYGATILAYEPDPTNTKVSKAWLVTNFFPKTSGDILGKRDLTAGFETLDLSIQWSSICQTSRGVEMFAQAVHDNLNLTNANPMMRKAFIDQVSSEVAGLPEGSLANDFSNLANSAVLAT